ncbi:MULTISPECIES: hypothetical protein [Serratia]|uniref:hypothetical protein n=1 Tax=Serratia TaxID=613 RepID=UPI000CF66471|nr:MULTISPECIES: hypothetical protein [Serratia]AVJ18295.1 hypothetical protein CLM71_14680 [Serratia sp. MYb239]MEB6336623.1 hypothetical protein [Serratia rhizosphaerae]
MNAPFYAAANRVIRMYEMRQQHASPAHSPSEIEWAADRLLDLALAAGYAASNEAIKLRDRAVIWKRCGTQPEFFPEVIEEVSPTWK